METDLERLTVEELRDLYFTELEKYVEIHERILAVKEEVEARGETL
jgi:hypothetical protein